MEKRVIGFGALFGALGGVLSFVFARIFAEPVIQRAIDYENGRAEAQQRLDAAAGMTDHAHEHEVFTRTVQENVGIGLGMVATGVALGLLFGVAYCVLMGRVGNLTPRNLAVALAAGMFGVLYFVPFLKYPANPPSIGHSETIGVRTALYLAMIALSVLAGVGAVWLGRASAPRFGNPTAWLLAGAAFIVVMAAVMLVLPSLGELSVNVRAYGDVATETPQPLRAPDGTIVFPGFDADDLYRFRLYSVAAQAILWATIAVGFGSWAARRVRTEQADRRQPAGI